MAIPDSFKRVTSRYCKGNEDRERAELQSKVAMKSILSCVEGY